MERISFRLGRHALPLPLAMEMQLARRTVSYREAVYGGGWVDGRVQGNAKFRVLFTVEILKFPYARVS